MNKIFHGWKAGAGLPGFIRNDFLRKLFALIITLLVTFLVSDIQDQEKTTDISNVPVKFELPPDTRFQSSSVPEFTATVTVRGKRSVLDRLTGADFEIVKKVTGKSLHDGNVKLAASDVALLKGRILLGAVPKIRAVSPGSFHLELDRIVSRDGIPIIINFDRKELPPGYVLDRVETPENQRYVTVTGPERVVYGLKKVETEQVSLNKATQNFTTAVSLVSPDKEVSLSFNRVSCEFQISGQVEKDFADVPVQLLLGQKLDGLSYNVTPRTVTVNLAEPATEVGTTKKEHIHPYVLVAGLKEGTIQCDVQCWCEKNDVRIISVVPEKVTVRVVPVPVKQPQPANSGAKK